MTRPLPDPQGARWSDPLADDEAPDPLLAALMVGGPDPFDALAARVAALLARPAWHRDAACRGMGAALFFPEGKGATTGPAKAVCATCPVVESCRAAGEGERGVWGGTSERDRRLVRSRSAPAA
jgi:WhiB family redox-sensing transcriptional regulator